jgi:phosphoribosylanthranilate isomerase
MFIKICANTNLEDARLAIELGADAVGFVFVPSKRRVTSEQVSEIVQGLPDGVEKVGVFATDDPFEVEHYVACARLTIAQLHRGFDADFVKALSDEFGGELKIIQTVAYAVDAADRATADKAFESTLRAAFAEPAVWAVLLDAAKSGTSGGLGVAFDWTHVAELVARASAGMEPKPRVLLAGGLNADNVAEAIATLRPWGVDVASGVEALPGKKDPQRLRAFIVAAREAALRAGDKLAV